MLGIAALDQTNVQRDSGGAGQLVQETIGQVAGETADMSGREIEIGDQTGIVAEVKRDVRERFGRGYVRASVPVSSLGAQNRSQRAPERLPGLGHLRVGAAGGDPEREIETAVARELLQQPVENGDTGLDVSRTRARQSQPWRRR